MKIILFSFLSIILILSCNKTSTSCSSCIMNCSHENGDISGNWKLESSKNYAAPGNDNPGWVNADPDHPVIITFTNDSLFSFNENYGWKPDSLDRYKIIDSVDFQIYSSNPSFRRPVFAKILNPNEIQIHYMGVDRSTDEKYTCY